MATTMDSPQPTLAKERSADQNEKLKKLRELYADAPDKARLALEKAMPQLEGRPPSHAASAGRTGLRQGKVSELTIIAPLVPGGGPRLRALLDVLGGNFQGADKVGTVHDMRFVLLDNDTKLLFATAYDGDWDPYIDDFATRIPDALDVLFSDSEGWPGIRSPAVKDWIAGHQITSYAWYVASPNLTVAETRRLERVGKALDEFLDKVAEPA